METKSKSKYSRINEVKARYGNCSTRTIDRGVQEGVIAPPEYFAASASGIMTFLTNMTRGAAGSEAGSALLWRPRAAEEEHRSIACRSNRRPAAY